MMNHIKNGIVRAIREEFGEGYEIYTESIEQGLHEPCFYIQGLFQSVKGFLKDRSVNEHSFMIQYFPKSAQKNLECSQIMSRVFSCLECIKVDDGMVMPTKRNAEMVSDVLHVTVGFRLFVRKVEKKEHAMNDVQVMNGVCDE